MAAYPEETLQKAVRHVRERMERFNNTEADAVAWAVIVFIIPYKVFIPYYYKVTGSCPEVHRLYLEDQTT